LVAIDAENDKMRLNCLWGNKGVTHQNHPTKKSRQ